MQAPIKRWGIFLSLPVTKAFEGNLVCSELSEGLTSQCTADDKDLGWADFMLQPA